MKEESERKRYVYIPYAYRNNEEKSINDQIAQTLLFQDMLGPGWEYRAMVIIIYFLDFKIQSHRYKSFSELSIEIT